MQLNFDHVSFMYPKASEPIIVDANITFPVGWTGLIGDNGCGKTTLAKIASGMLIADSGIVSPKLFGSYCPQDSAIPPSHLDEFAMDWGSTAVHLRSLLAIDESWLWEYTSLSGGQQKRIQIACALWREPDVLVMDEPTNDLDFETRIAVREALSTYQGIGILISHDRRLLDDLVLQCVMFENGAVTLRPGGYTKAVSQADLEFVSHARERDAARKEVKRLQAEATRRAEAASRSKSRLSAKNLAKGDSDKREKLGRAKVSGKDAVAGKASAVMSKRLERAQVAAGVTAGRKRYDPSIDLYGTPSKANRLIHMEPVGIAVDDFTLHVPELWVGPTDRIGITGRNGAGKTTLIKHLISCMPENVSYAFVPQEVNKARRARVLDELRGLDSASAGKVLSIVARLNSDPDRLREGSDISPGELRKLILAEQLNREPNLLILDEPTNHLDIGSIEALQEALAGFPAAIVLVSHDAALLDQVCEIEWRLTREGDRSDLRLVN